MKNYGNREQLRNARELRKNMTKAEIILWSRLRSKQIYGYKFRRQQPIFEYIVDFYCHELKLIIEADGPVHEIEQMPDSDNTRDKILKINGYKIIRFTNHKIETELHTVIDDIKNFIQHTTKSSMVGNSDPEK